MSKYQEIKRRMAQAGQGKTSLNSREKWSIVISNTASKLYFGSRHDAEFHADACAHGVRATRDRIMAEAETAIREATRYFDLSHETDAKRLWELASASGIVPKLYLYLQLCAHAKYRVDAGDKAYVLDLVERGQLHDRVAEKLVTILDGYDPITDHQPATPADPFEGGNE